MAAIVEQLVSTIIPVYNRPEMLRQAVDSVLAQSWRPIEIIISDDGSTDETRVVGQGYERAHPGVVSYLWNPNRGAGPARESGRQAASGEFIQYLDSDDTLWPRKFEVQVGALRDNPGCGAAYGFIRLCPERGAPIDKPYKWSGRELPSLFPGLLVDRWWNTDCPLWRRSVCDAVGPWSDLRYSQDWEYDARAGALRTQLVHCKEFVCDQRHHEADRQTGGGKWLEPADRVKFFGLLFEHALRAGVPLDAIEMRHFSRWVFMNVRQAGVLGDAVAARELLYLAIRAAGRGRLDLRVYGWFAATVGWRNAARLTERGRGILRQEPGSATLSASQPGEGH